MKFPFQWHIIYTIFEKEKKDCKYSLKTYKAFSANREKTSLVRWTWKSFSKILSKLIYQAEEVWFVRFYQKMIEIYQEKKRILESPCINRKNGALKLTNQNNKDT